MKSKIFTFIFFTSLLTSLQCQNVYIPDQNFKGQLIWLGVDLNNDNEISFDEAAIVNYLDISIDGLPIEDITGIEAFISLDTLICVGNTISTLDSLEGLPLKYLDCTWNSVFSIQFSLSDLEYLKCTENNLSLLNAFLFPKLQTLICSPSDSLIIDNPFLEKLFVESNIAINTNFAPELLELTCQTNSPPNLSNNSKLTYLEIFGQIENVDISENLNLKHLYIRCNLTSIDLTNNAALTYLNLKQNDLLDLDLSSNLEIDTLICRSNNLSSLNLSNNSKLLYVDCSGNNITNLNLSTLIILKTLMCGSNNLTQINLNENTALVNLYINSNQLYNIDLSMNTDLERLICALNDISGSFDLSQNMELIELNCSVNNIQNLDLSNNTKLGQIWCQENNLTDLNVNNLVYLSNLHCHNNNLTQLDLHTNVSIDFMQCGNNLIDSLDLSHNDSWNVVNLIEMPSLTKVCVSELPVSYTILTSGSPNITLEICSFIGFHDIDQHTPNIFPNPTTGKLTIENTTSYNSIVSFYNINGKLIFKTNLNTGIQIIDISNFPKGIYTLKILSDKNITVRKIVKK